MEESKLELELDLDKGPLHVSMREPYASLERIKKRDGKLVYKLVRGLEVNEIRKMKLIDIELNKNFSNAYVDMITGSLYCTITGRCFSSHMLYIVNPEEENSES